MIYRTAQVNELDDLEKFSRISTEITKFATTRPKFCFSDFLVGFIAKKLYPRPARSALSSRYRGKCRTGSNVESIMLINNFQARLRPA
jgi:hypothetical protein